MMPLLPPQIRTHPFASGRGGRFVSDIASTAPLQKTIWLPGAHTHQHRPGPGAPKKYMRGRTLSGRRDYCGTKPTLPCLPN